jgi:biuret amidohydrolase
MVDFPVVPRKLALLNIDLQNVFVEGSPIAAPDGLAVVDRINRLSAACRSAGVLVVHTAHVTRPDGSNIGVMGEIISPVREGIISRGSPSAALHPSLDVLASDIVLEKPRFGAFHGTDLELILRARSVDSVIVTGIATNVCVETTVREKRRSATFAFSSRAMAQARPTLKVLADAICNGLPAPFSRRPSRGC